MFLRKSLVPLFAMILTGAGIVAAQQAATPSSTTPNERFRERSERRGLRGKRSGLGRGMRHRGGARHFLRELNLTDEQRQQSRAIIQRRLETTKSQREELFRLREKRIAGTFTAEDEARAKALHQEMRTAMEGTRAEMEALLTADQKARLEQLMQERKTRMEERMKKRQELNQNLQ